MWGVIEMGGERKSGAADLPEELGLLRDEARAAAPSHAYGLVQVGSGWSAAGFNAALALCCLSLSGGMSGIDSNALYVRSVC